MAAHGQQESELYVNNRSEQGSPYIFPKLFSVFYAEELNSHKILKSHFE